jgi:hypothetical protein
MQAEPHFICQNMPAPFGTISETQETSLVIVSHAHVVCCVILNLQNLQNHNNFFYFRPMRTLTLLWSIALQFYSLLLSSPSSPSFRNSFPRFMKSETPGIAFSVQKCFPFVFTSACPTLPSSSWTSHFASIVPRNTKMVLASSADRQTNEPPHRLQNPLYRPGDDSYSSNVSWE